MHVSLSTEYWIKPGALTIYLNYGGKPDFTQVSVLSGAVIMAFSEGIISYNAAYNFRTWPLIAYNTYINTTAECYVYARLDREESTKSKALIVYDTEYRDIEGRIVSAGDDPESNPPSKEAYFILLGKISASVDGEGNVVERKWIEYIDYGQLNTDIYTTEYRDNRYVHREFFEKVFSFYDKHNNLIPVNEKFSEIDSVESKLGLWTEHYLSCLGKNPSSSGGGGGGASALYQLLDVLPNAGNDGVFNAVKGSVLTYNGTKWQAGIIHVPTNLSEFNNDSGFITSAAIPTKLSAFTNDSGFITSAAIPTKLSAFTNDSGFITSAALPTKVSQLNNDAGYITGISKSMVEVVLTGNITSHTHTFASITSKPTTLTGYGITDGVNSVKVSGSGNAVTAASVSGHVLTLTKVSSFLLQSSFDDLFEKVLLEDGKTYAIRAKYGFYSDSFVSAKGANQSSGGSSGASALYQLLDVLPNASNDGVLNAFKGSVLTYNGTKWQAGIIHVPTNLSEFNNDSGFITSAAIPTKLSAFTNDSGFITSAALPTKLSAFTNDSGFITSAALPTKVSQLNNDAGYITGISKSMVEVVLTGNITSHTHTFASITSKPDTLAGYGITDGVNSVKVSGSGNAVTAASVSGHVLTLTKGVSFLPQSSFDDLFEKVLLSDGKTYAIRAKYGFYSDSFVSAKGLNPSSSGGGGGGASALYQLLDVVPNSAGTGVQGAVSGTVLMYNGSKWQAGIISVPNALSQLTNDAGFITSAALPTKVSQLNNDAGYITGINSSMVVSALGYTPYNSSNPNGYISGISKSMVEGVLTGNITSHTHDYLPLSGGTITGDITTKSIIIPQDCKIYTFALDQGGYIRPIFGLEYTDLSTGGFFVYLQSPDNDSNDGVKIKSYRGSSLVTVLDGGNVGIGEAVPSYKLHVVGDIYTTTGFKKNGSSDSYILLGGGGHKLISYFANSEHTHSQYLTEHQSIYSLTFKAGTFIHDIYTPNSEAKIINIPTTTSHIREGNNLYFTNQRAINALSATLLGYQPLISDLEIIRNSAAEGHTAYGWGNHANVGYLTGINSTMVVNALGYTPYNNSNPNGYISGITKAMVENVLTGNITSHSHNYLPYVDTRDTDIAPYSSGFAEKGLSSSHLKYNTTDGLNDGGDFHVSIYIYPWRDPSGGCAHNLAFTDEGNMWLRSGTSAWDSWKKILNSSNYTDYAATKDHTHTFASITSKPTTISGYGITDAYTATTIDSKLIGYLPLRGGTITGDITTKSIIIPQDCKIYTFALDQGGYIRPIFGLEYSADLSTGGFFVYLQSPDNDSNDGVKIKSRLGYDLVTVLDGGNVGIGATLPSEKLHVVGNIIATGAVTAKASSSDIRLKTDISNYDALSIIRKHRSVKYHWNEVAKANADIFNDDDWHYGLIAQDMQRDMPQMVSDVFRDYLVINYERLIPICWKGLQEVDDEVSMLKKKVRKLEKEIRELKQGA